MSKTRNVLWLSLAQNVESTYIDFRELARLRGISIQPIPFAPPVSTAQLSDALAHADGFFLTFQDAVLHEPFRELIAGAIKGGKRMLVLTTDPELNPFLMEFDLSITQDRLCGPEAVFGDERTILVRREDQNNPTAKALLDGIADLTVAAPRRVWYGQTASPIFKSPPDSLVLSAGNYFEDPGPRELCCGGIWETANGAALLALTGGALCDPFSGVTGKHFAGIRANPRFAERLLDWLVKDFSPAPRSGDAVEMLQKIEVGLHDFVTHKLKTHFNATPDQWWYEGVPEPLRKKNAELSEASKGKIPKEQGFYLISYREIIEENWPLFSSHFDPENLGKKKALAWFAALNEIRNRLSHPLRLREHPLTGAEHREIEERKSFVDALCLMMMPSRNAS